MKFSNTTFGFYPSNEDKLSEYSSLPDDLQEISDEDYLKFLNGDFGTPVQAVDGQLESRVVYKSEAEMLADFLRAVSKSLATCNSVGLQCYMISAAFPDDWVSYRAKLVALSATTEWEDTLSLPTQPDLPSGVVI